ncbi:hypothetical protein HDU80_005679 [Chytriomyces hyalinus]|nr:hypothetical protein HDU80_005679 [Chytriomyces hyalinus]
MEQLVAILASAQLSLDNVTRVNLYITDLADFAEINKAYALFFSNGKYPARTCVAVSALIGGTRIEIEATARLPVGHASKSKIAHSRGVSTSDEQSITDTNMHVDTESHLDDAHDERTLFMKGIYCGTAQSAPAKSRAKTKRPARSSNPVQLACVHSRCKNNPNCLSGMAAKTRAWLADNALATFLRRRSSHNDASLANLAKTPDLPVGLKNLAATCYLNTLLQVWFHTVPFRSAVYAYELGCADEASDNIMSNLKIAFAYMQCGSKGVFDPRQFVDSLKIDSGIQQDAQEFSKLFTATLENLLSHQTNPNVRTLIKTLFEGECAYVTRCKSCSRESRRAELFRDIELSITESGKLTDSFESYLAEEHLDAENKWYCPHCETKVAATRQIKFARLPPVLNIQLLRFVYDVVKQVKRKVRTTVCFPNTLDMNSYLGKGNDDSDEKIFKGNDPQNVYTLSAVLMHRGTSAYAGHFIARIRDPFSGHWYTCNDENVTKLEKVSFDLVDVDLLDDDSGDKVGRSGRGGRNKKTAKQDTSKPESAKSTDDDTTMFSSSVAYMLIYTSMSEWNLSRKATGACFPPESLMSEIRKMNEAFDSEKRALEERQEKLTQEFEKMRALRTRVAACWQVFSDSDPCYYVDFKELKFWFEEGLVAPDQDEFEEIPEELKSQQALEETPAQNSENGTTVNDVVMAPAQSTVFDNRELLCEHQKLGFRKISAAKRISKAAGDLLLENGYRFNPPLTPDDFCHECAATALGEKASASNHAEMVDTFKEIVSQSDAEVEYWISAAWLQEWQQRNHPFKGHESVPLPTAQEYLQHVLCPHGNLDISSTSRKSIPMQAFEFLTHVLGDNLAELPIKGGDVCAECDADYTAKVAEKSEMRRKAVFERNALKKLADTRQLPTMLPKQSKIFYVPADFITAWREFLKDPINKSPPENITNASFICEHGELSFDPFDKSESQRLHVVALSEAEWDLLFEWYDADVLIEAEKRFRPEGEFYYIFTPAVCMTCKQKRMSEKPDVLIKVVNISDQATPISTQNTEKAEGPSSPQPDMNGKRKIASVFSDCHVDGERRQSKRLKDKTSLEIRIDKTKTVLDLKTRITAKWDVPPIHQQLYFKSRELTVNSVTLESLGVEPHDVLEVRLLKEDRGLLGDENDFSHNDRLKERGFAGSNLLGFASSSESAGIPSTLQSTAHFLDGESEDDDFKMATMMSLESSAGTAWTCSACTYINERGSRACTMCESSRE